MSDSVQKNRQFVPLIAVILSAVSVVSVTFGLFNSMLKELMPQVEGAVQTVSFVSFGTVIMLLALTLLIRRRLRVFAKIALAVSSIALLVVAGAVYLAFTDQMRDRVYFYPPSSGSVILQRPYVSGPYHERGAIRAAGMSLAMAVSKHGGPDPVNAYELLWTSEARSAIIGQFVRYYMALAFLMTTALYIVAIALWRTLEREQAARKRPMRL